MSSRQESGVGQPTPQSAGAGAEEASPVIEAPTGLIRKALYVLTPDEKRQLALLAPAVVVMAILETIGIASIVPFLGLLSNPNAIAESELLSWAYAFGAFSSRESFFFAVGLGVLLILTTGNAFSALTTWGLLRFSWMRNHSLSLRLLGAYLGRPYAYFLTRNTSQLSQKLLAEVQQVTSGVFVAAMKLVARLMVVIFILGALLALDPVMALGVGVVFGGVYGSLFFVVRSKLTRLGKQRLDANRSRYRLAAEMLTGIKEVKLAGLEQTFLERYGVPSHAYASAMATNQIIAQLPRFALETIAFGGVMLLVLFSLRTGKELSSTLPVLGVYAFAAYRILPSLQQVFAGLSGLRTNAVALDSIIEDIPSVARDPDASRAVQRLPFTDALTLKDVRFRYEGADEDVLKGVSLTQRSGDWVALVGPTGSGKSTLVDVLLGLLEPSSGELVIDGARLYPGKMAAWQANAGYVPQQIFLADDTVARNIAFGAPEGAVDQERLEHAARVAQIHGFIVDELPEGYATRVGERGIRLSGGQRQRLGIARAIYREPRFLVLDEATSALDNDTEARFFEALREALGDVSVVSIAHRLTTTRSFDCIFVLEKGRVVEHGTYEELLDRSPHFAGLESERQNLPSPERAAG